MLLIVANAGENANMVLLLCQKGFSVSRQCVNSAKAPMISTTLPTLPEHYRLGNAIGP